MGKNILAEKILVEVAFFCKELARLDGKPSDIRELTNMSISNVISSIIFGKRFEFDDPQFVEQLNSLNDIAKLNSGTLVLNFFPFLFYIPVDLFKVEQIGTERAPSIADKPRLKYFTAVIMEVQRRASILPITIPYFCSTDTTLAGYTIPKNTVLMPNLDAVLRSKEIWGDPENFRPERFLDEQGHVVKREELISFSVGRRVCLGESLAKIELFLYLSNLIQTLQFLPARPDEIPPLKDTWGLAATPEPFEIKCVKRNA
ncbi:cytochrome P450 2U1 [Biomphalaria pfeifferi]|uniref:Cytochrome P450 2U1 n=1 Tax=Biomphalaria pfeifferi TaxID=112525 RepID=A0AAD8FFG0_BIOPF|nr:cytochrome P450 2U1 [Biomphalaria pfeifferi]